ncbi:MAG: transglycosylase domain-containing protein [Bacteroidota bacterium]|nr:transglycosylase domain-containing protein [Bacteroidota bacterium]
MRMHFPSTVYSKLLQTPPVKYVRNLIADFLLKHPGFVKWLPTKRQLKRFLAIFLSAFLLIVILLVVFRRPITESILHSKIESFNESHRADLKIGSFQFKGLLGIEFKNITLKPQDGDTLLTVKDLEGHISLLRLLRFEVGLSDLTMVNTHISLIKTDTTHNNYMFLLESNKEKDTTATPHANLARRYDRLLEAIFSKIPSDINIQNFILEANMQGYKFSFNLPSLTVNDELFQSTAIITDKGKSVQWHFEGKLNPLDRVFMVRLFAEGGQKVEIPYIDQRWHAKVGFDTVQFSLENSRLSRGVLSFEGNAAMSGLTINHPKLSPMDISIPKGTMDYNIHIGENYYEVDSTSTFTFNRLSFKPYIRYQTYPDKQLTAVIHKEPFPAQDLFDALPSGLFTTLDGIKTDGQLSYDLDFFVDLSHPDNIHLYSNLKRHNFKIVKYGNTDFRFINAPFSYTAYENGVPVRTFPVGPDNPNFRYLNEIPDNLKNAILTSEDGQFFYHNGFIPDAITKAISTDLKRHRFAKGGSTISQQLVKNVFLNRNKTIARKVEEAMITWLIENNRLSSKERMFEVYLNILEMGPMVYGVNEGAHFYFNKDVRDLTLAEAIFMASIIPHPKTFRSSFDSTGTLKPYMDSFYKFVAGKMLGKGQIMQSDYDMLTPNINLTGRAKDLLRPASDTLQPASDSTELFDQVDLNKETIKQTK